MVVLYSNHCPLCNNLKEELDAHHIEYKEVNDIDLMLSLGITKTPILEVAPGVFLKYKDALEWIAQNYKG